VAIVLQSVQLGLNMLAFGMEFEALAAFEPDPVNYTALIQRTREAVPAIAATFWPCGLDATTRQMRFHANGLASSGISDDGELVIQTVSFDEALTNWRPNYVKLDIEGAEASALRGMADTLRRARPAVAVCIYHKPADLWELPRQIDDLLPDSRLYIRSHAWNGFELVLYAVPREMRAT
jgi:FkbM family methyltransferase